MRKSFRMFLALALVMLGAVSVNAQERIPLTLDMFYAWDGYKGDAAKIGPSENCALSLGVSENTAVGDSRVIDFADLTLYSKLIVTVAEGSTPRVLFNRLEQDGQATDDQETSKLIDIPGKSWCTNKYQSVEGNVYTYDLKAIAKDYGFVHLHAIKGANYSNVTIESVELETSGKVQQVGWTEITTNADLEGDDVTSFVSKVAPANEVLPAEITDGVGVDGTRGIMIAAPAKVTNDYETQFWIVSPEVLTAGTQYRLSFDCMASADASVATQAHAAPGDYIHWEMAGNVNFTTSWQRFSYTGEVTEQQAGTAEKPLTSIALNLSMDTDIEYYFDNIRLEVYKYGVTAEFAYDVIKLDFGFDTNLPALVAACGKPRLMFPANCASVKVGGTEAEIMSIEGTADGRFYIFMQEMIDETATVEVAFSNPTDAAYHLTYDGGPGGDVKDFAGAAAYNYDVAAADDAYAYIYVTPIVVAADPENGSFNLPNNITDFKVTFDKNVDCAALVAKLGNEALTVEPAEGFAESVVLKRASATDLPTGEYALSIDKIYPEQRLDDAIYGDTTYVINIGKVNLDPSDTLRQVLPDYFAETGQGGIPQGWYMVYDGAVREPGTSHGAGANMKEFAAGGDFTRGFYTRTNNSTPDQCIVEYGSLEGYALTLEAGKKYKISYNLLSWKGTTYTRFEIYDPNGDIVYTRADENKGTVNGATGVVVSGSNFVEYTFYPETTGDYKLRWTPSNANGELVEGMTEIVFANPKVTYLPNAAGVEETQALLKALDAAKGVLTVGQSNERYAGAALEALAATVAKYDAEYSSYTNPSAYTAAIAALDAAAKVMGDHRNLCDTYYALPEKAQQIVDDNASKKFAGTDLYVELQALAAKYVTKQITTTTETDENGETVEKEVVTLIVKTITDDAELQAAIDELQVPVNTSSKLFTEGESNMADTGIKVLVERLRLGAEGLKAMGVAADDKLVVAAYNALDDDDELAEEIKTRMKMELYGKLKDADNTLFTPEMDTITLEYVYPSYDMTVFVKNPNIYRLENNLNFTSENVPGWATPEGQPVPGLSYGWNDPGYQISDVQFQTWGASYVVEQTIVDLPDGVYNIVGSFGERNDEASIEGSYFYVKTATTPEGEYADSIASPVIGQSFPKDNIVISGVTVTDGMLTIGAKGGPASHTFFNQVKLQIAGADPTKTSSDYAAMYDELVQGIDETVAAPAKVLGVELYDLNGRRIMKAQKGIFIMRKFMNDGSIKVEKIFKK